MSRFLPEVFALGVVFLCHRQLLAWASTERQRRIVLASGFVALAGLISNLPLLWQLIPASPLFTWGRGVMILWAIVSCGLTAAAAVVRLLQKADRPAISGSRRLMLRTAQTAIVAAPVLVAGYGSFIERKRLSSPLVDIKVPGLPKDLDGIRIAQVSDIHLSSFLTDQEFGAAIDLANSFRPNLTVITGDLITRDGDPLDACLAQLGRLKAEAGVYGCMGNHEIYAECEDYVQTQAARLGLRFLRNQAETLRFGSSKIRLAGVDYQKKSNPYLVDAQELKEDGAFHLLLSHSPDVFDVAAAQGWNLTLAGHTHGGQITVEYLNQHLNIARFFTPYVYGKYEKEKAHLYVTRGIGTVGVPARIGAEPEVALIRLCAT